MAQLAAAAAVGARFGAGSGCAEARKAALLPAAADGPGVDTPSFHTAGGTSDIKLESNNVDVVKMTCKAEPPVLFSPSLAPLSHDQSP